ncbi:MAG TPA: FecR domain-containing protein [Vicinamibacterales bacterium]|jgi:hypothetical protein
MKEGLLVGVIASLVVTSAAYAQQPASAGRIKLASGSVSIVRNGSTIPAQAGQFIYESDSLRTGGDGRVGVTLNDDTRISLGPNSEVRLDKFAYSPAESQLALVLRMVRGAAAYVSGRIAKLAPDSIRLETPAAIVGVRGTTVALRVAS